MSEIESDMPLNDLNITNAWISNCYFYDMSSSSSGGAISFSGSDSTHFLVEKSNFVNCRMTDTSGDAGAINVNPSNSVLKSICCYNCHSSNYEGGCNIYGPNSNSNNIINYVHDSSVAYCVASSYYTMVHEYGYIEIKSVNLSHNQANQYSALDCAPSSKQGTYGTSISYSSFADNTALYSSAKKVCKKARRISE